jgi:hypothetical protein
MRWSHVSTGGFEMDILKTFLVVGIFGFTVMQSGNAHMNFSNYSGENK